ncbi:MAG: hypothetical protein H6527_00945 [Actinobacteria bacterium]|nr:hypothetical protein [Actinomycetota bacterium]
MCTKELYDRAAIVRKTAAGGSLEQARVSSDPLFDIALRLEESCAGH